MKRSVNSAAMAASLLISISLASGTNAQGVYTPELGGYGGAHFEDDCRTGDHLIGFNFTADKALNSIGPVCHPRNNEKWRGEPYGLRTWGKPPTGHEFHLADTVRCKRDQFVTALHVWWDKYGIVHHVEIFCHNASRSSESTATTYTLGGEPSHNGSSPCQKGLLAVGMVGRYGALIDRIGLKYLPL